MHQSIFLLNMAKLLWRLRDTSFRITKAAFIRAKPFLPIQCNKIFIDCYDGRGFGDNPKYIALEILRQHLGYDLVWALENPADTVSLPNGIRHVKKGSIRWMYEASTAKIWIDNLKNGIRWKKRKGQYYIQTWHGGFPLKYIEQEAEQWLSPEYVADSKADSGQTDLILSDNKFESDIIRHSFWYNGEIFEKGTPRIDILLRNDGTISDRVKAELNIPTHARIALYAPTFRNNDDGSAYTLDTHHLIQTLHRQTGETWYVVVRLHPNVRHLSTLFTASERVVNGTAIADLQELLVSTDLLITDYSSLMVEFSMMQRPVILYMPDLSDYLKERGLRPIFNDVPFLKCRDKSELENGIKSAFTTDYLDRQRNFLQNVLQHFNDGHASEYVVERIKAVIEGTFKH